MRKAGSGRQVAHLPSGRVWSAAASRGNRGGSGPCGRRSWPPPRRRPPTRRWDTRLGRSQPSVERASPPESGLAGRVEGLIELALGEIGTDLHLHTASVPHRTTRLSRFSHPMSLPGWRKDGPTTRPRRSGSRSRIATTAKRGIATSCSHGSRTLRPGHVFGDGIKDSSTVREATC